MPALRPIEPPYDEETTRLLESYPRRDGYLLSLFRTIAASKRHLAKIGAAGLLDRGSPLTMREREIVILRTTANLRCEYEWGVHVTAFATHVGFTSEQIVDTTRRVLAADWSVQERLLLAISDELCAGSIASDTLTAVRATWSEAQQLEIASLVGFYHTISNVIGLAKLELEPWGARFPIN